MNDEEFDKLLKETNQTFLDNNIKKKNSSKSSSISSDSSSSSSLLEYLQLFILFIFFCYVFFFSSSTSSSTYSHILEADSSTFAMEINASNHVYPYTATVLSMSCLLTVIMVIICLGSQIG